MKKKISRHRIKSIFGLSALIYLCSPVLAGETEISAFVLAGMEERHLHAAPDFSGSLLERPGMTGEWGGMRQRLADHGIQLDVTLHQYFQSVVDGGRDIDDWEDSGSFDYRLELDTEKAGLWSGGILEVHGETYFGMPANLSGGGLMPVNTDYSLSEGAGNGTYLPHVVYTQMLSESFGFFFGKLDPSEGDANSLAHGSGDERFQNLAFSFNPVTLITAPYSTLGAGLIWNPIDDVAFTFTAYDLEGEISTSGVDTAFDDGTAYNAILELKTGFFDQPGYQRFGFTYAEGDFVSLNDPRILLPPLPAHKEDGSWSAFYNFEQHIQYNPETDQGWGVFGRVGISDEETNPIPLFLSAGVGGTGIFPGRPNDRFGIGYYYLETSDQLPGLILEGDEQGLEIFYDVEVTPWFRVAGNLQVISPALKSADTAVVFGLRSGITF